MYASGERIRNGNLVARREICYLFAITTPFRHCTGHSSQLHTQQASSTSLPPPLTNNSATHAARRTHRQSASTDHCNKTSRMTPGTAVRPSCYCSVELYHESMPLSISLARSVDSLALSWAVPDISELDTRLSRRTCRHSARAARIYPFTSQAAAARLLRTSASRWCASRLAGSASVTAPYATSASPIRPSACSACPLRKRPLVELGESESAASAWARARSNRFALSAQLAPLRRSASCSALASSRVPSDEPSAPSVRPSILIALSYCAHAPSTSPAARPCLPRP